MPTDDPSATPTGAPPPPEQIYEVQSYAAARYAPTPTPTSALSRADGDPEDLPDLAPVPRNRELHRAPVPERAPNNRKSAVAIAGAVALLILGCAGIVAGGALGVWSQTRSGVPSAAEEPAPVE